MNISQNEWIQPGYFLAGWQLNIFHTSDNGYKMLAQKLNFYRLESDSARHSPLLFLFHLFYSLFFVLFLKYAAMPSLMEGPSWPQ